MIEVKFDNSLQIPAIQEPLATPSEDEVQDGPVSTGPIQTRITGILAPLVRINEATCGFSQVKKMTLHCSPVPEVDLVVEDTFGIMQSLDQPTSDNSLQIQIIPPYDNAYKKINITFYMDSVRIVDHDYHIHGIYNIPKLHDTQLKSYGKISTYEFFEKVAHELQLGFCSNISDTQDKRYIYMPNSRYSQQLRKEADMGGSEKQILEWWVDLWNNLNLVDVYQQYNTTESDEDLLVWTPLSRYPMVEADDEGTQPQQMVACLTNNPKLATNPFYTTDLRYMNTPTMATDRDFEVYDMQSLSSHSTLIEDGDVKNDIFVQYEYGGELFGDYDYLTQRACRDLFLAKINGQKLKMTVDVPAFALMKGHKVNVYWYDLNPYTDSDKDDMEISTNSPMPEDEEGASADDDGFRLNKQISGQYYIIDTTIKYSRDGRMYNWRQEFELGRPADKVQNYN